jgi:hypothetical protein
MNTSKVQRIVRGLDRFCIELLSWGFANTGTRFGKFIQAAAATTPKEKFSDRGQVQLLTGVCPTIALHVLWDFPNGIHCVKEMQDFSARYGMRAGSINPNLLQDQEYKYGSFGNPDSAIRKRAFQHFKDFKFNERARLPFRSEFFDITKHLNFDKPVLQMSNPNFGRIQGSLTAREIQLSLKLIY